MKRSESTEQMALIDWCNINVCIYPGLYIEMKYGNGRTSKEQREWINKLNEQGYKAVVCNGFEEAKETIEKYIKL